MKDFFIKLFMDLNAFLIRLTHGRIGCRLGTQTILLLETTGRKSGQPREVPIAYFFHDGDYLIVASNWGKEEPPDWFRNLMLSSQTTIQVQDKTVEVEAHQADGTEYGRLWQAVTRQNSQYLEYQKGMSRRIPIVILTPQSVI